MLPVALAAAVVARITPPGFDLLLATVILSSPAGAPVPDPSADVWPGLRAAVIRLATRDELLDERGEPDPQADCDLFDRRERFAENVDVLRERRKTLAGAPPVADSLRFPPPMVLTAGIARCRKARERALGNEVIGHLERVEQAWQAAADAANPAHPAPVRRESLQQLRKMLGDVAYRRAELPEPGTGGSDR